jgi:glycosyltransferase involved in cell wall biosynthesis
MSATILHLIASNFVGGPEKQILHHARDLEGSPYSISVASFKDGAETPEILSVAAALGMPHYELPGGIRPAALNGLIALLRQQNFSILCTHGYKSNVLGRLACMSTGTPQVAFVRGWTAETWRVTLYERLERLALKTAPWVVCVSAKQAEQLASARKGRTAPVVVPNAILPAFQPAESNASLARQAAGIPEHAFVFGSVGRLSREKGHRYLLDAFARASAVKPDANFFLVLLGEGRELEALRQQAAELKISDRVKFAGFQRDCGQWMRLIDCLVQPSLTEGTPNSVLEALVEKLPIVATAVGGVPDLITDRKSGLLVPPADPDAFSAAMLEVYNSPALREQLAQGALSVGKSYLPETQRDSLIAVYQSVLQQSANLQPAKESVHGATT